VTEYKYKGITLNRAEDKGWKCLLGEREYLFPHCQAAETAIDAIFGEHISEIIANYKGVKLPKAKK
jgi:hypothetical protein